MVKISDLAAGPIWHLLGIEPVDGEDGEVILRAPVVESMLQVYGKVHGGVLATLVDASSAVAVNQVLGAARGASTLEMKINYLRPVDKGMLYAKGEVVHLGRTMAVTNATVWDDQGRKIAYGTATFIIFDYEK